MIGYVTLSAATWGSIYPCLAVRVAMRALSLCIRRLFGVDLPYPPFLPSLGNDDLLAMTSPGTVALGL
jgi:hypothetical protein